jgi:hypothetical protein
VRQTGWRSACNSPVHLRGDATVAQAEVQGRSPGREAISHAEPEGGISMPTTERALVRFLAEYEARVNRALGDEPVVDVDETAAAFTNCFVAATPNEVVCNANDAQFRASIPRGFEFYRKIGTKAMRISSLAVTELDDCHAMVKVRWHSLHERSDASEVRIDFDVIYLFRMARGGPQIFGYITGDEDQVLRDHGLVAA